MVRANPTSAVHPMKTHESAKNVYCCPRLFGRGATHDALVLLDALLGDFAHVGRDFELWCRAHDTLSAIVTEGVSKVRQTK